MTDRSPTGDGPEDDEPEGLEPWSETPAPIGEPPGGALTGPPGGRIFSLEDRPVPALYLGAWLFSVGGLVALLVATQAELSPSRSLIALGGHPGTRSWPGGWRRLPARQPLRPAP